MVEDTFTPIEVRSDDHCFEEQLTALAFGELQPSELALVQAHVEHCGSCHQRLETWRILAEEPEPSEETGPWVTVRGGARMLREPIRVRLSVTGALIPVHGPPRHSETIVSTTLFSASDIEVHKWLLEDRDLTMQLEIRVADLSKREIELPIVLVPRTPARLEISNDSDEIFASCPLWNFDDRAARVGAGRWLLRLTVRSPEGDRVWELPLELIDEGVVE